MRIIKFRAWDKDSLEMDYGNNGYILDIYYNGKDEERGIVMQYTGLKDKNGKEIYEGDIVRVSYDGTLEYAGHDAEVKVVEWGANGVDDFYPAFDLKDNDMETNALSCAANNGEIEIIGNIYENPALLTKGE